MYFQQLGNLDQTPPKEEGQLRARNKCSVTGDIRDGRAGSLVKAQRQRRRRDETEMEREDAAVRRAPV